MPQQIQGPDGRVHTFPDGIPDQAIDAAMMQMYGGGGQSQGGLMASPQVEQPQQTLPMPGVTGGPTPYERESIGNIVGLANGSGLGRFLQSTQQEKYDQELGTKLGDAEARIRVLRAAAPRLTQLLDKFADDSYRAGSDVLSKAIGPNYDNKTGYMGSIAQFARNLPSGNIAVGTGTDTGSPAYTAEMATRNGSGDPNNPNAYDKAAGLNAEMHHIVEAAAQVFKSIPGASNGVTTNDAMETLKQMLDAAVHAPTPESHFKIVSDAKDAINSMAGYRIPPPRDRYTPPGFGPEMPVAVANAIKRQGSVPVLTPEQAAQAPKGTVFDTTDSPPRRIMR